MPFLYILKSAIHNRFFLTNDQLNQSTFTYFSEITRIGISVVI